MAELIARELWLEPHHLIDKKGSTPFSTAKPNRSDAEPPDWNLPFRTRGTCIAHLELASSRLKKRISSRMEKWIN